MIKDVETTDFDELSKAQEDWDVLHRPLQPERFRGRLRIGHVGCIQVDIENWSTALELSGTSPARGFGIALPLDDRSQYLSEGREVGMDQLDVFGPGQDIHALIRPDATLISCSIEAPALEHWIGAPPTQLLMEQATGHNVTDSTRQTADELRDWLKTLLALSASGSTSYAHHSRLLDDTLSLIISALTAREDKPAVRGGQRYRIARRARDYMLARQSDPPTTIEVCDFLNISERTLRYAFRDVYGVSPKRFLKAQRLLAARQALKSAPVENRVADIALDLGFWELGYFAKDYRNMFGELPSTTLKG